MSPANGAPRFVERPGVLTTTRLIQLIGIPLILLLSSLVGYLIDDALQTLKATVHANNQLTAEAIVKLADVQRVNDVKNGVQDTRIDVLDKRMDRMEGGR